ncbi:type II toxin-antitoxin system Phd/YefM family antitoxin [Paenibacillus sp. TRM 82003]|nr:type II toxin-antitoxin system Phd/YefM family antitoxin [Paenibacillus sp. TRM 82003]
MMIVSSTELQNNFGKYLQLAAKEDVIVTRNGQAIARLTTIEEPSVQRWDPIGAVAERAETYGVRGRKATYEEFLTLTKDNEERYEYIDGEIYWLASPKTAHQSALSELFGVFYLWFQGKPCRPFVAPYDIELRRSKKDVSVVQPDLMVICDLDEHLGDDDYYKGVPTLVVEILSASTRGKDMVRKLDLYMSCGVKEYWIVNPLSREVTVYWFEEGDVSGSATYKNEEVAQSQTFEGLTAELKRIFR